MLSCYEHVCFCGPMLFGESLLASGPMLFGGFFFWLCGPMLFGELLLALGLDVLVLACVSDECDSHELADVPAFL